jgi:hypothetical protein
VEEKPSETECHESVHSDAQSHEEHIQAAHKRITNNGRSRALSRQRISIAASESGTPENTVLVSMFNVRIARQPEVIAIGFPKPTYRDKSEG